MRASTVEDLRPRAQFPKKLSPLFQPARYKVLYGGRGGAKSWSIARALLLIGSERPLRIVCLREIQKTIADSVHQLLRDQIKELGLSGFYKDNDTEIVGKNGTTFNYHGLRDKTSHSIKSLEGTDIAWVEEAVVVTKRSWDMLTPTIRKENSEIWLSFNPELEEDETYKRFVTDPPHNAVVINISSEDNPFLTSVLKEERAETLRKDPNGYDNIWGGKCKKTVEGAIFGEQITKAGEDKRITRVPHDPGLPVHTIWDLGFSDKTAIWFVQRVGMMWHVIDYLQGSQRFLPSYVAEMQTKGYVYGTVALPFDGKNTTINGTSAKEQMEKLMPSSTVITLPDAAIHDTIELARQVFPSCAFDKEKCADGIHVLRRYKYAVDPDTKQFSKKPEHDDNSHGGSAWRYFGLAVALSLLKDAGFGSFAKLPALKYPKVQYV